MRSTSAGPVPNAPNLTYKTAGAGLLLYALVLQFADPMMMLYGGPATPLLSALLEVEAFLFVGYLTAGIGLRWGKAWGKTVAIVTAITNLAVIASLYGLNWQMLILKFSWFPSLLGGLRMLAPLIITIAASVAVLLLIPRLSQDAMPESDEADRTSGVRRGRHWFWGAMALAAAVPLLAIVGASSMVLIAGWGKVSELTESLALLGRFPILGIRMLLGLWPFLILASVAKIILSGPARMDRLDLRRRMIMVSAGLAALAILSLRTWFFVSGTFWTSSNDVGELVGLYAPAYFEAPFQLMVSGFAMLGAWWLARIFSFRDSRASL